MSFHFRTETVEAVVLIAESTSLKQEVAGVGMREKGHLKLLLACDICPTHILLAKAGHMANPPITA